MEMGDVKIVDFSTNFELITEHIGSGIVGINSKLQKFHLTIN